MVKFKVEAGPHRRTNTPISVKIKGGLVTNSFILVDEKGGKFPAQTICLNGETELCWILDRLEKFDSKTFSLIKGEPHFDLRNVPLEVDGNDAQTSFLLGSQTVMSCQHSKELSKPFVFPLNGPKGTPLTWNGPPDHIHHRSVWTAHGMVNGENLWSEEPGHGTMSIFNISRRGGYVFSEIRLQLIWQSVFGKKLIDEERTIRLWNIPDKQWLIDYASFFTASYGDVLFGDTKEAGTISIRVRESMEVENGGKIENSWGGINEAETWGRKANWCDYSGPVDGIWQGVAIFDDQSNPRHPSYWHVRDYGLMTANVFGATEFKGRVDERGGLLIKNGDKLSFRYRIYVHKGNAYDGGVSEKYLDYAMPPRVSVIT